MLSLSQLTLRVSAFGLFVLFPGFLVYHTLISFGIPDIFGGLFGGATLLLAVFYLAVLPKLFSEMVSASGWYALIFFVFLLYVLCWMIINFTLKNENTMLLALIQSLEVWVMWLALFMLGYWAPLGSLKLQRAMWTIFVSFALYLLFYVATTGQVMFNARLVMDPTENVRIASYQGFARSAFVLLFFLLAISQATARRMVIIVLGVFILFLLGARSELYAFIAVAFMLLTIWSSVSSKYLVSSVAILGLVSTAVVLQFDLLTQSRQLQVLDLSSASSWIARKQLEQDALAQIIGNPLFGEFGGHVTELGEVGGYAHSVLSVWVNYGIMGITLYLALVGIAFLGSAYYVIRKQNNSAEWVFALTTNAACLLLVLTSKSVFWGLPALGWGAFASAIAYSRKKTMSGSYARLRNDEI